MEGADPKDYDNTYIHLSHGDTISEGYTHQNIPIGHVNEHDFGASNALAAHSMNNWKTEYGGDPWDHMAEIEQYYGEVQKSKEESLYHQRYPNADRKIWGAEAEKSWGARLFKERYPDAPDEDAVPEADPVDTSASTPDVVAPAPDWSPDLNYTPDMSGSAVVDEGWSPAP